MGVPADADAWVVPVSPPRRRDSTCMSRTNSSRDLSSPILFSNDEEKIKPRNKFIRGFTGCALVLVIYFVVQLVFVNMAASPEQALISRLTLRC